MLSISEIPMESLTSVKVSFTFSEYSSIDKLSSVSKNHRKI